MKKIIMVSAASLVLLSGCQQVKDWSNDLTGKKDQTEEKQQDEKKPEQTPADEKGNASAPEETTPPELQLDARFFNDIKEVDGHAIIQNPSNILAMVNKDYGLGEYKPDDLVRPDVPFVFGEEDLEKAHMRKEAAEHLEDMFAGAKKDNLYLTAISGYRSYDYQKMLLEREKEQYGDEKAVMAVAPPGNSEHQSGLAMDISSQSHQFQIDIPFGETEEGKWLAEHAHEYGFILRYPEDKEEITKYQYEPWHFRYVGKEAAKVIYDKDWTLEEYFDHVKEI
ncbi:M15 family metallopeptidase [Bacillus sp. JRC01]|nr:M15 family metallopeptidase [Bacillus sp. JRC01]